MTTHELPSYILPELREQVQRYLDRKPATLEVARVNFNTAEKLYHVGRPFEAAGFFACACVLIERLLGKNDPWARASRKNLACCYGEAGRLQEGIAELERLVKDCTRVLGKDHIKTLTTRYNLADFCYRAARLQKTMAEFARLVEDCSRVLGNAHVLTLASRGFLAMCYEEFGRLQEASAEFERLVEDHTRFLGKDNPNTLASRNSRALNYLDRRRVQEAITEFERLIEDCNRVLGESHQLTLVSRQGLAHSYSDSGQHSEAIAECERLVEDCTPLPGEDDELTFHFRHNLAFYYGKAGRLQEGIAELERLVEDCTRVLGENNRQTTSSLTVLAEYYIRAGRLSEAEAGLTKSLESMERVRVSGGDALGRALTSEVLGLSEVAMELASMRVRLRHPSASVVEAIELGAARSVLDLLQRRAENGVELAERRKREGRWSQEQFDTFKSDLRRLGELEAREKWMINDGQALESDERRQISDKLTAVRGSLAQMERELLPAAQPRSLKQIRDALRPGEVLLLYSWCHLSVTLTVIPKDGGVESLWLSEADDSKAEQTTIQAAHNAAEMARGGLVDGKSVAECQEAARQLLIFALPAVARAKIANASRVIIVPSGPLYEMPLDVLAEIADVKELSGKPVTTAPSASIFAMLRERGVSDGPYRPGIVGDPDFGDVEPGSGPRSYSELDLFTRDGEMHLKRLPRAGLEARLIASYFEHADPACKPALLTDAEATLRRVHEISARKRVIHLAAHAKLAAMDDPMGSAVVLAQGEDAREGLLRVDTLLTQWAGHLEDCDLVVLSCCHTAGGVTVGNSLFALPIGKRPANPIFNLTGV